MAFLFSKHVGIPYVYLFFFSAASCIVIPSTAAYVLMNGTDLDVHEQDEQAPAGA